MIFRSEKDTNHNFQMKFLKFWQYLQRIHLYTSSKISAKLKTSNNKHLTDLTLNSPRIILSQLENIILDNRDTKAIYFTILEATQNPPKLVINKNAKTKDRGTWIPFKI